MEEEIYVTVTGFGHYYHKKPFTIGNVLVCTKDQSNLYDSEAIAVGLPIVGQVGYIANSVSQMAGGTMSAGRIYDKVGEKFYIRVLFTTQSKVICRIESGNDEDFEREIREQLTSEENMFRK